MAFQDNTPIDIAMPGYVIYRDILPGEPYDPSAAPIFFPPKDSDELFDALRLAFPGVKTHSERMRDAMIKFLVEERQAEMAQHNITPLTESVATSPWQQSFPSMSSSGSSSTFSSPDTLNLATPTFGMSPQPQIPQLSRHLSSSTSATPGPVSISSPAGIEGMTGVFSVSTSEQPKQRVRRKMTEAEKVEYRKRRMVKACDKCSKRKRKCNHNQSEMEILATKQKITKSKGAPASVKPLSAGPPLLAPETLTNAFDFGFDDTSVGDMLLFDDYTNLFEEDPVFNFGGLEQPKPCVPHLHHSNYASDHFSSDRAQPGLMGDIDWQYDHSQQWNLGGSASAESTGSGNGMLWEHLRTGQQQPTHTRHFHEALGEAAFAFDNETKNVDGSPGRPPLSSRWPNTVLQLTATAKAVRKLSRGLRSNGTRQLSIQLTAISDIAAAIGSPRSSNAADGYQLSATGTIFSLQPRSAFGRNQTQMNVLSPLDGRSVIPSATSSLGLPYPSAATRFSTMRGMSREATRPGEESASTSVSSSRGTPSATHQGRPVFARGTGEGNSDKPWAELNMLKRRIPKSLHSVTDRNNNLAAEQQAVSRPDPGMQLPGKRNEPIHSRLHSATLTGSSTGLQPLPLHLNPVCAITDLQKDRSGALLWQHRNQDTFRCRDHFGRITPASPAGVTFSSGDGDSAASPSQNRRTAMFSAGESILFVLAAVLLLITGMLGSGKLSASALALAVICPASDGSHGLFWASGGSSWMHSVMDSLRSSLGRVDPMNQDDQKRFVGKRKMGSDRIDRGSCRPLAFGLRC